MTPDARQHAVDAILRKAQVRQTHRIKRSVFLRLAAVAVGATTFGALFVWIAMALTAWEYIGQLFQTGFDLQQAWAMFVYATRSNITVAGCGLLGLLVGAVVGLFVDL